MAKFIKKKINIDTINSGNTYRNEVDDVQADTINALVEGCAFSDSVAEEAKIQSDTAVSTANNALSEARSANYKSDNAQNAAFQAQKTASDANTTSKQAHTKSLEAVATANKVKSLGENQPDVSDANTVGVATAAIEELSDGGLRFKFSNLKGEKGDKGDKGDSGAAQHITLEWAESGTLSQEDLNVLLSSEVNYVVMNSPHGSGYVYTFTPNVRTDDDTARAYLFIDVQRTYPDFLLFVLDTENREWELQTYDDITKSFQQLSKKVNKSGDTMTGLLKINTYGQTVEYGSKNNDYSHIETTAPQFYMNKPLQLDGALYIYNKYMVVASDATVYDKGQRVYSPSNPPTASGIGAVPISGGQMTGALGITGVNNQWGRPVITTAIGSTAGYGDYVCLGSNGQTVVAAGETSVAPEDTETLYLEANSSVKILSNTDGGYSSRKEWEFATDGTLSCPNAIYENGQRVYSPNNKPSPSSLGSGIVTGSLSGTTLNLTIHN